MDEQKQLNSLSTPSDFEEKFKPAENIPLTDREVKLAVKELNQTSFVRKFPQRETRFADEPIQGQKIGLFSFVPAKGSQPNEKGIYGFAKIRGVFPDLQQSNAHAEKLIRSDTYHKIYHTLVGFPFPLTTTSQYSLEVAEVDIRKDIAESVSHDVKKKREEEQRVIEEIKNREKELLEDVKKDRQAPEFRLDAYTEKKVKLAQLSFTYIETEKKMKQMKESILKTRDEIEELDKLDEKLKEGFMSKYMKAREEAGLDTNLNSKECQENYIKYMMTDAPLDF